MKLKTLIFAAIGLVITAAAVLFSIGHYGNAQNRLNKALADACDRSNGYAAALWLAKGADVNTRSGDGAPGERPLTRCVHMGNYGLVEMLLMAGADVNAMNDYESGTALHFAQDANVADLLVVWGADLNKKNKDGLTPLQYRTRPNVYKTDELVAALEGKGPSTKVHREARKFNEEAIKAWEAKKAAEEGK